MDAAAAPLNSAALLDEVVSALRRGDFERARRAMDAAVVDVAPLEQITIQSGADGRPTVARRRDDESVMTLSPANQPIAAMASILASLRVTLDRGTPIGLCGTGDGYTPHALAADQTPLFLEMQQPVFIFEPDVRIALHCLMIHDYSGPAGPIEQPRFHRFIGPDWAEQHRRMALADLCVGVPPALLSHDATGAEVQPQLAAVAVEIVAEDAAARDRIHAHYARIDAPALADRLSTGAAAASATSRGEAA